MRIRVRVRVRVSVRVSEGVGGNKREGVVWLREWVRLRLRVWLKVRV